MQDITTRGRSENGVEGCDFDVFGGVTSAEMHYDDLFESIIDTAGHMDEQFRSTTRAESVSAGDVDMVAALSLADNAMGSNIKMEMEEDEGHQGGTGSSATDAFMDDGKVTAASTPNLTSTRPSSGSGATEEEEEEEEEREARSRGAGAGAGAGQREPVPLRATATKMSVAKARTGSLQLPGRARYKAAAVSPSSSGRPAPAPGPGPGSSRPGTANVLLHHHHHHHPSSPSPSPVHSAPASGSSTPRRPASLAHRRALSLEACSASDLLLFRRLSAVNAAAAPTPASGNQHIPLGNNNNNNNNNIGIAPSGSTSLPASPLSLSSSLAHRRGLVRRRRCQDLSSVKESFASEFGNSNNVSLSKLQLGRKGLMDNFGVERNDMVPRYSLSRPGSAGSDYHYRSPHSLSAENLHTQYVAGPGPMHGPTRPHSMSEIHSAAMVDAEAIRRHSDPTETVYSPQQSPLESTMGNVWAAQSFSGSSIDGCISESTDSSQADLWSNHEKTDDWAHNEELVQHQLAMSHDYTPTLGSPTFASEEGLRLNNVGSPYGSMVLQRQPPSPTLDGNDISVLSHAMKRTDSFVPSPPDSPGFHFSANNSSMQTPEMAYNASFSQGTGYGVFGGAYADAHHGHYRSNSAIPPTPPSRPSSANASGSGAAAAAASALAATSKHGPSGTRTRHSVSSSRPSPSRRRTSNSSMRATARAHAAVASCSSSSGDSEMSFVNFTPHDSARILSGVAPSGSSKTKARREKEAAEKRRKLSEATVAAVLAVGGNVEQLKSFTDDIV